VYIFLHALPLFHCTEYTVCAPSWAVGVQYIQRYDTAVHNCTKIKAER